MLKRSQHFIKGIQRDLSVSKFNPEYAFDAQNIRITAREDNTLLSVTNEKGNVEITYTGIPNPLSFIPAQSPGSPSLDSIKVNTLYPLEGPIVLENVNIRGLPDITISRFTVNPDQVNNDTIIKLPANSGVPMVLFYVVEQQASEYVTYYKDTNPAWSQPVPDLNPTFEGTLIGYCILNNYVTLFTTGQADIIYRLERVGDKFKAIKLYSGNLGFSTDSPIETLGVYENRNVQKVYWIDGKNQARMINIVAQDSVKLKWNNNSFDFVQDIKLLESISIKRNDIASGSFAPGTIQYAFSYYNIYGQQSNIFYTSPLEYISFSTRGASPEDKVSNSFDIVIKNPDQQFDYVRIYSIQRSSIDATPSVLHLTDISTSAITGEEKLLTFTDNGTIGTTVDPTELLYIGGEGAIFGTMTQKDNTLFLGNVTLQRKLISQDTIDTIRENKNIGFSQRTTMSLPVPKGYYPYTNTLSLGSDIKTLKYLDWYRFGIQGQYTTGKWSEPIWINDAQVTEFPTIDEYFNNYRLRLSQGYYYLQSEAVKKLVDEGFVKVRGVIVYPTLSDREVVAQGILCPTVFNVEDRWGNSPFAQASWFTRPDQPFDYVKSEQYEKLPDGSWRHDWRNLDDSIGIQYSEKSRWGLWNLQYTNITVKKQDGTVDYIFTADPSKSGSWAEFRHLKPLPDNLARNCEIQCTVAPPQPTVYGGGSTTTPTDEELRKWVGANKEYFYVDRTIVTFHSPEIEFNTEEKSIDSSSLKLRIVGVVPMTSFVGDIDIQTSTPPANSKLQGFYKEPVGMENISSFGFRQIVAGAFWFDDLSRYKGGKGNTQNLTTGFAVYPWHRNGSLNNFGIPNSDIPNRPAMLQKKKMSNMRYSLTNYYYRSNQIWNAYVEGDPLKTGISGVSIFNSNEQSLIRIPAPLYSSLQDINYYGNIDKIVNITRLGSKKDGYPIVTTGVQNAEQNPHMLFAGNFTSLVGSEYTDEVYGTEPVRIKYKSTPHAVLAFNYSTGAAETSGAMRLLPTLKQCEGYPSKCFPVNETTSYIPGVGHLGFPWFYTLPQYAGLSQDVLDSPKYYNSIVQSLGYGWLWLGELYNDNVANRFGGQTEEAFENNIWLPAGEAALLISGYEEDGSPIPLNTSVQIYYTEGDTFYQRYDCLKTYPYTLEDQNSVVDIVSFMCESRINIDGRYDQNRGQVNNLVMTPSIFNKLNPVYSQKNNFFNYRGINHNRFNIDKFPNTVTWTKEKQAASIVDAWTNITLSSTLDLDGDKGEVISLNTFNNEIFAFQRRGLSNILFNSRVQIPASDGMPIEITNGLKVGGKRYISNTIGCSNKWSIVESPLGLYFIDNETNSLYLFNGQIDSLSDKLGFRQWINAHNVHTPWDPLNYNNYRTFYDKNNNDVYFTYKDHCLCYSELLGQFTSFMSYEEVPAMYNVSSDFYAFKNGKVWEQFAGDYNMFFGVFKPFSITMISNAEEPYDKIFNTVEFRADTWDGTTLLSNTTFDTLDVWNEYQNGTSSLTNILGHPSSLKKKFRVWRADIPRDSVNNRDRIRNTWAYIRLSMNKENVYRTEFHDAIVHYFA